MIQKTTDSETASNLGENSVRLESVDDPDEIAGANRRRKQFDANAEWLQQNANEVYSKRGKYICVAGRELFVADSSNAALALADSVYPEDDGKLVRYIPKERLDRIYACEW